MNMGKIMDKIIAFLINLLIDGLLIAYLSNFGILVCILIVAILLITLYILRLISKSRKMSQNINDLKRKNENLQNIIERTRKEILENKSPMDIILNIFREETESSSFQYSFSNVDVDIAYVDNTDRFDVAYSWNVVGFNSSQQEPLRSISFVISGDYPIRDNHILHMHAYIILNNNERKELTCNISGYDKVKCLEIDFNEYYIAPNQPFQICYSYSWEKTYNPQGDTFSFGRNVQYPMTIKIKSDPKCFSIARLHIKDDTTPDEFSNLDVIESNGKNIAIATLAGSQLRSGKAIYIILGS